MLLSSLIFIVNQEFLVDTTLEYFFFHFCLPQFYLCKGKFLTQVLRLILRSVIFHFKYIVIVSTSGIINSERIADLKKKEVMRFKFLRGR